MQIEHENEIDAKKLSWRNQVCWRTIWLACTKSRTVCNESWDKNDTAILPVPFYWFKYKLNACIMVNNDPFNLLAPSEQSFYFSRFDESRFNSSVSLHPVSCSLFHFFSRPLEAVVTRRETGWRERGIFMPCGRGEKKTLVVNPRPVNFSSPSNEGNCEKRKLKSTWTYENRVSKHFVISLNFPCPIASLLSCFLICLFLLLFVLCLEICVEVAVDRISRISFVCAVL